IAFIEGTLAAVQLAQPRCRVTISANGIGYCLQVPPRLTETLPAIGATITLHSHLVIRDTEMLLYGFSTPAERDVFVELIGVSGVGPSLGLALLSTLSLPELIQAIVTENARVLSLTPGVGTKTARRLALELKSKMAAWREDAGLAAATAGGPPVAAAAEVEMALLALGYTPNQVAKALHAVSQSSELSNQGPKDSVEVWLRAAIAHLSASQL
ncbi:MAG: Holliday junction branch migration protein RuvA, partial [Cyanobacteria bacterium J06648_11]